MGGVQTSILRAQTKVRVRVTRMAMMKETTHMDESYDVPTEYV